MVGKWWKTKSSTSTRMPTAISNEATSMENESFVSVKMETSIQIATV